MNIAKNQAQATTKAKEEALDRHFKVWNSNIYYENSYMEYYYFYQQCRNYFETANVKSHQQILFAVFFFKKKDFLPLVTT